MQGDGSGRSRLGRHGRRLNRRGRNARRHNTHNLRNSARARSRERSRRLGRLDLTICDLRDSGDSGGGSSAGGGRRVSWIGDAELRGVLVGAGGVVDELDAVVGGVGLEGGGGRPGVGAAVVGAFDDGVEREDVLGGAAEEDERYGAGCGWLGGGLVLGV